MDNPTTGTAAETDVLQSDNQSKLSAAEVAKAVAHHQHHHPDKPQQDAPAKPTTTTKGR
jgi:hypothetical protein